MQTLLKPLCNVLCGDSRHCCPLLFLRQEQEDLELKHTSILKQLMREFNTQLAQKEQELERTIQETIREYSFKPKSAAEACSLFALVPGAVCHYLEGK